MDVQAEQVVFPEDANILSLGSGGVTEAYTTHSNLYQAMEAFDWPLWESAINSEFASHQETGTYLPVSQVPAHKKAIGTTLVLKVKLLPDGNVDKYKAILCAQGFFQKYGVDYSSTFSPASNLTTFRLI